MKLHRRMVGLGVMRKADLGTKILMLMKAMETSKREGKNGIVK